MEERMLFAGFGGQGVLFAGKLLAHAGMLDGKYVTWIPSYGPEMRGGTANCAVVIADKKIGSPIVNSPQVAVVMNKASFDKFHPLVSKGGTLLVNASMVKNETYRDDINVYELDTTSIAEECGSSKVANMVIAGAALSQSNILSMEAVFEALKKEVGIKKPELLPLNETAIKKGMEAVQ